MSRCKKAGSFAAVAGDGPLDMQPFAFNRSSIHVRTALHGLLSTCKLPGRRGREQSL